MICKDGHWHEGVICPRKTCCSRSHDHNCPGGVDGFDKINELRKKCGLCGKSKGDDPKPLCDNCNEKHAAVVT